MIKATSNFLASSMRNPVAVVQLGSLYFTTGTFSGITSSYKKLIDGVSVQGGEIDPVGFKTGLSGFNFEVVDKNDDLRTYIEGTQKNLNGLAVTLKIGFADLAIADFVTMPAAEVVDWEFSRYGDRYKIKARDQRISKLQKNIATGFPSTLIDGALGLGAGDIATDDTSDFTSGGTGTWGALGRAGGGTAATYLYINGEFINYTGETATDFQGISRAQLGSMTRQAEDDNPVSEAYVIVDSWVETLIQILTGDNQGTSVPFGLGFDADGLDTAQMRTEYQRWYDPDAVLPGFSWSLFKEEQGEEYIVENILKILPAHFVTTDEGLLGIKIWDWRCKGEGTYYKELEDDHKIQKLTSGLRDMITNVYTYAFWSWQEGRHFDIGLDELTSSLLTAAYGTLADVHVDPKNWEDNGMALYDDFTEPMVRRYLNNTTHGNIQAELETFFRNFRITIGDIVSVTNPKIPNLNGDGGGWDEDTILILKNDFYVGRTKSHCLITGVNFDCFDDVSSTLTHNLEKEATIQDTSLALNSPGSDATETNDAYCDPSPTLSSTNRVCFTIEADLPGNTDSEESITVELRAGDSGGPTYDMQEKNIYYNASWTGKLVREIDLYIHTAGVKVAVNRAKVDWIAQSAGAGDRLTNVKLVQVKFIGDEYTVS